MPYSNTYSIINTSSGFAVTEDLEHFPGDPVPIEDPDFPGGIRYVKVVGYVYKFVDQANNDLVAADNRLIPYPIVTDPIVGEVV